MGRSESPSAGRETRRQRYLDNRESWFDFTDLVFIDPVGIDFSPLAPGAENARKMLWSDAGDLNWRPEGRYMLLNGEVSGRWNYGSGHGDRESMSELRNILTLNPNVRVLVTHGYTDLVTP